MFTIFLYNSLETFVNYIIPENYEYKESNTRRTTIWDKGQIQRDMATDKKLWTVLPDIFKKRFEAKRESELRKIFANLKECRDEINHTKHGGDSYPNGYKNLFVASLEFDCSSVLESISEIINFYEPGLIEECGCGKMH